MFAIVSCWLTLPTIALATFLDIYFFSQSITKNDIFFNSSSLLSSYLLQSSFLSSSFVNSPLFLFPSIYPLLLYLYFSPTSFTILLLSIETSTSPSIVFISFLHSFLSFHLSLPFYFSYPPSFLPLPLISFFLCFFYFSTFTSTIVNGVMPKLEVLRDSSFVPSIRTATVSWWVLL